MRWPGGEYLPFLPKQHIITTCFNRITRFIIIKSRQKMLRTAIAIASVMILSAMARTLAGHSPAGRRLSLALVLAVIWGIAFSELTGPKHDYVWYIGMWQLVLDGRDPWEPIGMNTYGPLFNILALPSAVDPLLPKLVLNCVWLATSILLVCYCQRQGCRQSVVWGTYFVLLFGPFPWGQFPRHGLNDAIPASICVLSVHLHRRGRFGFAGIAVAAGWLFKLYPVLVLPYLVLGRKRIEWQVAVSAMIAAATGAGFSIAMWGPSATTALLFNADRPSTHLSIFYTFRTALPAFPRLFSQPDFDSLSIPAMMLAGLGVLAYGWRWQLSVSAQAAAGILAMLLLYRVGHPQFLVAAAFLTAYWLADRQTDEIITPVNLLVILASFWGWLSVVEAIYPLTNGFSQPPWDSVHPYFGLFTFFLGSGVVLSILRTAARDAAAK